MEIYKSRIVKTPSRGSALSAGLDFYVPEDHKTVTLEPGQDVNIPSGIHAKVPPGYVLIMFNKSGRAFKNKLIVGAQVIDEDYQGEIHLHVFNAGRQITDIYPGEKLVQGILIPLVLKKVVCQPSLEKLYEKTSERGNGGFGSTGLE